MGALLECELVTIDQTNMRRTTDLFGAWVPYEDPNQSSALDNHLQKHAKKSTRNVMFLAEPKIKTHKNRKHYFPYETLEHT